MKNKLKRIAASVLTLALLAVPVLAAAEPVGSRSLNVADGTVYTYSTQAVTSDSGKQTNLHENIFTYKKEAQAAPICWLKTGRSARTLRSIPRRKWPPARPSA